MVGFKNLCFDRKEGVAPTLRMTILQTKLWLSCLANFLSVSCKTSQFQHRKYLLLDCNQDITIFRVKIYVPVSTTKIVELHILSKKEPFCWWGKLICWYGKVLTFFWQFHSIDLKDYGSNIEEGDLWYWVCMSVLE